MIGKRSLLVVGAALTAVAARRICRPAVVLTWPLYQEERELGIAGLPHPRAEVSPARQAVHELLIGA